MAVTLDNCVFRTNKRIKISFDGGDSGSKKGKRVNVGVRRSRNMSRGKEKNIFPKMMLQHKKISFPTF
jgi:hypothetical protein